VEVIRYLVGDADGCAQDDQAIMKKGTATEGGRGPVKLFLNGWGKGMEEGGAGGGEENTAFIAVEEKSQWRAAEAQEFEEKAHVQEGRIGVDI
jgi:hypothetical protein